MIPPDIAINAPDTATPAYTRLLTNLVDGLVIDEKKIALNEYFCNLSLISSKRATASSS